MENQAFIPNCANKPLLMEDRFTFPKPNMVSLPTNGQLNVENQPSTHQEGPVVAELHLSECTIQAREGKYGNYFLLVNYKNPEKPLRLYKPAAVNLINMLPEAFDVAKTMELQTYPEGTNYTVATIKKWDNFEINLYVKMFQGKSYVFVRMFMEQEDGSWQPSTYGVQISNMDNIQTITNFVNKNKWK